MSAVSHRHHGETRRRRPAWATIATATPFNNIERQAQVQS